MIGEGILAQDDEEEGTPTVVVVGRAIQDHGHEHLDVEDGNGGGVDVGVVGLILVEGGGAGGGGLLARDARLTLLLGLGHGIQTRRRSSSGRRTNEPASIWLDVDHV